MFEPAKRATAVDDYALSPAVADSVFFIGALTWGLRPRLYAYACYRRLRSYFPYFLRNIVSLLPPVMRQPTLSYDPGHTTRYREGKR